MTKEEFMEKIEEYCENNTFYYYVDYNDRVEDKKKIRKMLDGYYENAEEDMSDLYTDCESNWDKYDRYLKEFYDKNSGKEIFDSWEECKEELEEEGIHVYMDIDFKGILKNTPDSYRRISLYSNYDQICSNWLETSGLRIS